jgi:hypothetical protein
MQDEIRSVLGQALACLDDSDTRVRRIALAPVATEALDRDGTAATIRWRTHSGRAILDTGHRGDDTSDKFAHRGRSAPPSSRGIQGGSC